ncbi:fasciclin domain-containing protein [Wenzhouxiangella sediminis]|uniref:Fasciclin domain-containing protein n=2 Tax=Wenzhouxiangella sediminis TaxID=1792836 RepID=A0A3E1K7G1_9GAMM|nr:fasciclin domain-containing protein [Wenzhouxiangella sediminis]
MGATLLLATATAALADDHGKDKGMAEQKNIVETAIAAGQFNTLVTAVQEAGLVETLSGEGPFTVFAPTDEAFAKIPEADLNALLADKEALTSVLTYHVVAGKVKAADVVNLSEAETVQGSTVDIKVEGDTVMIDNARVIQTDIMTSNGVIHVIDTVIMP